MSVASGIFEADFGVYPLVFGTTFRLPNQDFPIQNWQEHAREVFSVNWNMIKKDTFVSGSWDHTIRLVSVLNGCRRLPSPLTLPTILSRSGTHKHPVLFVPLRNTLTVSTRPSGTPMDPTFLRLALATTPSNSGMPKCRGLHKRSAHITMKFFPWTGTNTGRMLS